jgi:hypothetical protein
VSDKLVIHVGQQVPPDMIIVEVSNGITRITVNTQPEAEVVATLREYLGDAVVDAVEARPSKHHAEFKVTLARNGDGEGGDLSKSGGTVSRRFGRRLRPNSRGGGPFRIGRGLSWRFRRRR